MPAQDRGRGPAQRCRPDGGGPAAGDGPVPAAVRARAGRDAGARPPWPGTASGGRGERPGAAAHPLPETCPCSAPAHRRGGTPPAAARWPGAPGQRQAAASASRRAGTPLAERPAGGGRRRTRTDGRARCRSAAGARVNMSARLGLQRLCTSAGSSSRLSGATPGRPTVGGGGAGASQDGSQGGERGQDGGEGEHDDQAVPAGRTSTRATWPAVSGSRWIGVAADRGQRRA